MPRRSYRHPAAEPWRPVKNRGMRYSRHALRKGPPPHREKGSGRRSGKTDDRLLLRGPPGVSPTSVAAGDSLRWSQVGDMRAWRWGVATPVPSLTAVRNMRSRRVPLVSDPICLPGEVIKLTLSLLGHASSYRAKPSLHPPANPKVQRPTGTPSQKYHR